MAKPEAILIFGAPGAGKGTMGPLICDLANHYHLSTGDIFRGLPASSENGQLFFSYAKEGKLVPDDVTMKIWWTYTQGLINTNKYDPGKQSLLLDGLPRTVEQAQLLDEYVNVTRVIALDIQDENVIIERLGKRAKIEKRADDANVDIVRKRLQEYHEKTAPVLGHYPKEIVSVINAEQSPAEVLRDILIENAAHI